MQALVHYLRNLSTPRAVLWCYLIWYLVMAGLHFDPAPRLWLSSLGISGVIGIALLLSVSPAQGASQRDRWQTLRLFLMPFCVSSFSALIKDRGFVLIFSPVAAENLLALALCCSFLLLAFSLRRPA